jgi:predicted transcriptional regulator
MNWKLYSFVVRSKRRVQIIKSLEIPKTPTQIAKDVKSSVSHISRTLKQFEEKGIIECLTPKEKVGRIYKLTKEGKKIAERIKS